MLYYSAVYGAVFNYFGLLYKYIEILFGISKYFPTFASRFGGRETEKRARNRGRLKDV